MSARRGVGHSKVPSILHWIVAGWAGLAASLLALPVGAQGPSGAGAPTVTPAPSLPAPTATGRQIRLGPRDKLRVVVDEIPTLAEDWTIAEDGSLNLDPIGRVPAQGLTEAELAQRIKDRLEKQGLRRANVTVTVTAWLSRPVVVLGAVVTPGNQGVGVNSRLMEVLLAAGGLAAEHGPAIQIRRAADNGLSDQISINVRDLVETLDPDVNIPIFAGDVINVAPARAVQIHLLGAVKTVGTLVFKNTERVTLLTAIARAGGLADTASRKISLKRTDPATGRLEERLVDFKRILDGKEADVELQDGDILVVKESFF